MKASTCSSLFFAASLYIVAEIVDKIYGGTGPPPILFLVLGALIIVGSINSYFRKKD